MYAWVGGTRRVLSAAPNLVLPKILLVQKRIPPCLPRLFRLPRLPRLAGLADLECGRYAESVVAVDRDFWTFAVSMCVEAI